MDQINLRGLRFQALIGILPHEREIAQPLEVDISVEVSPRVGSSMLIDYRGLYEAAADVIRSGHTDYIEDVAERIAAAVLRLSKHIATARVAVRKLHVPLPGPLRYAEVVIERHAAR